MKRSKPEEKAAKPDAAPKIVDAEREEHAKKADRLRQARMVKEAAEGTFKKSFGRRLWFAGTALGP